MGTILLFAILLLPLALGMFFRVSTSHLFFSIMAGELLARYFGHDVEKQVGDTSRFPVGELLLVIGAMLLTAVFLKGTITANKLVLHVVPLLITGIILAAFLLPLLPSDIQSDIAKNAAGKQLLDLNKFIVGGVVVLQLISLWLFSRHHEKKHHSH